MTATVDAEPNDPVRAEFDPDFYLASNPDVLAAGLDPYQHFMSWGWREGRDPNRRFSLANYLDVNPDIGPSGMNPFVHYVVTGRGEGRALRHDLGFRYDILKAATPLEDRIQALRRMFPDAEPTDAKVLARTIGRVGESTRLHVSISHDDYTANLGGVQLCLRREAKAMRAAGAAHIHLFPTAPGLVIDFERQRPLIGLLLNSKLVGHFEAATLAEHLGPLAAGKVLSFAVHSFIGHNIGGIMTILQAMGASEGFYWVHDFSSVCAHYALLRDDVAFCGAPPPDSPACGVCVYGQRRRIHLAEHARFFRAFSITVLAPSQAALDLWSRSFPIAPAAMVAHPHARLRPRRSETSSPRKAEGPLRVAFLGMPTDHKGWPVFAKLVERFCDDTRYAFHHLGKAPDPAVQADFTMIEPTPDVAEPMAAAVEALGIDLAVIWSLCPETFCFTAYEAVAGGAAVMTNPDAGNVPRFVTDTNNGMVAADEHVLMEMFERGDVLSLARSRRGETFYSLVYSRMSADFLAGAAS
ncbi:MAG: hypothetical protein B7Y99_06935 [Caulobacterales bacterium 32-69-10]|nr:MAG: hypothetical protein B7Y99_06935 [Caulobacterales bacterium 32-69-10]